MPAAITLEEVIGGRSVKLDDGMWNGIRRFIAYGLNVAEIPTAMDVIRLTDLPKVGDHHPEIHLMTCDGYTFDPDPDRDGTFRIDVAYSGSSSNQPLGNVVGHVSEQMSLSVKYVDVWRNTSGVISSDDLHDEVVQGAPMDTRGDPTSFPISIVEYRVVENLPYAPNFLTLGDYVATRNSTTFAGAPARTIVYGGASSRKVESNVWQISHLFYMDNMMKHYRQRAVTGSDGKVELASGADVEGHTTTSTDTVAKTVRWSDPFPVLKDHRQILSFNIPS